MSLSGEVIVALAGARTVDAVAAAVQVWAEAGFGRGVAQLIVTDRGTGRLITLAGRAQLAHEQGEVTEDADGSSWSAWVPLRGLAGPIGVLGLEFPPDGVPPELRSALAPLTPVVAMALDRVLARTDAEVYGATLAAHGAGGGAGLVLASEQAELIFYSDEMVRLTGWTAEEIRARGFFDCLYPDPVQRARAVVSARESLSGTGAANVAWWFTRKDGVNVPCRLTSTPIAGPEGRRYVAATFVDASAAERDAAEMQHAELGRFAAAVNHDFNNLLAVVQGHAEVLREHPEMGVRTHADSILTVSVRAARLTRQLAAFGRDQPMFRAAAELGPICDDVLRQFRSSGHRASISSSATPDLPPVELDPSAVKHLLLNLLENARDAAGPDGRLSVDLRRAEPPPAPIRGGGRRSALGWVRLRVVDDGPGFSAEARRKLFEPFYTTKGVGHGLGLAAVARIAEGLEAVVDVPHQIGRGAIVDVYLPVAPRPPVSEATQRDPAAGGNETIWLVDDDPAVLEVLALGHESFGYQVRKFEFGEDVLAALDGGDRLDLLVSDLVMPGMDGVSLYRALRSRGSGAAVLFVSGYAKSGVDVPQEPKTDFVSKPVPAKLLAERARRLLNYVFPKG